MGVNIAFIKKTYKCNIFHHSIAVYRIFIFQTDSKGVNAAFIKKTYISEYFSSLNNCLSYSSKGGKDYSYLILFEYHS